MRRGSSLLVAVALAAACSGGDGDGESAPTTRPLTPTFAPTTLGGAVPAPTTTTAEGPSPTTVAPGPGGVATTAAPPPAPPVVTGTGRIADRVGDATVSADPPPRYADLAGGVLTRTGDRMELRVRLGAAAPATSDPDHTMNVASFYDVEGDGRVDFEVWANLADTGWGTSWFDDRGRGAVAFGERSGVAATVEDGELVLRFGLDRLGGAGRFQWSLASEWGRYEVIGTVAAARDDAPDSDGAVAFPEDS